MSKIDLTISNEVVIPRFETDLFQGTPDNLGFAIGMVASGAEIIDGREDMFAAYLRLRARVYADQTRMIDPSLVRPDGTEIDEDDLRSTHWAVFERTADEPERLARVIGCIRTIEKLDRDPRRLPIEDFFSEAFDDELPVGAVEVSRYISRHENPKIQAAVSGPLFRAVVGHVTAYGMGPTFGVVEEPVERALIDKGVPLTRIAEPKFVDEYDADNLGFEVHIPLMAQFMGLDLPEAVARTVSREREMKMLDFTQYAERAA